LNVAASAMIAAIRATSPLCEPLWKSVMNAIRKARTSGGQPGIVSSSRCTVCGCATAIRSNQPLRPCSSR
jgi:hypothetical protein